MTAFRRVTATTSAMTPLAIAIKRGHPDVADRIRRAGGR